MNVPFQSIYIICGPLWAADSSISIEIPAHFRIAGAAATHRAVSQEFLSSRSSIYFAGVNISLGIDCYHVRPVELTRLATAAAKPTKFRQVLPVDHIDDVISEIGNVHAGLLRVGREVHRTRRAADGLRSNMGLPHKTTLAYLAIRV